jgi:hypothetical protein
MGTAEGVAISVSAEAMEALRTAVEPLPTSTGGIAIVLATVGPPPAISLLSSGDVALDGDMLRLAVYAGSSTVARLGGSCTLLVPSGGGALRVELLRADARPAGPLAVIEGRISSVRPSHEPPWSLRLDFLPIKSQGRDTFLEYWRQVRAWLMEGARGDGPAAPSVNFSP